MNADKKRIRNFRILVAVLSALFIVDFYTSLAIKSDFDKQVSELHTEIVQLNEALQYVYEHEEYEREQYAQANEQLIAHCRPCDVNRAIKATPLPELKKDKK